MELTSAGRTPVDRADDVVVWWDGELEEVPARA